MLKTRFFIGSVEILWNNQSWKIKTEFPDSILLKNFMSTNDD